MAEFIKKWFDFEETRIVTGELYEGINPEDLMQLRNNVANWTFGKNLSEDELGKILGGINGLTEGEEIIIQQSPTISLRRNRSTLTMETMGMGRRVGRVSYDQNQFDSDGKARAIVEYIESKKGVPTPLQIHRN